MRIFAARTPEDSQTSESKRLVFDEKQEPKLLNTLSGHSNAIFALAVLSDGNLASGSHDFTIKIWNPKRGEYLRTLNGHSGYVKALAVLDDGSLASGSYDHTIKIWNPKSGECLRTLSGHSREVEALAVLDDGNLASGSGDDTIKIWNPTSGKCLRTLNSGYVKALAVLDDDSLVSGSHDGTIKIWNSKNGECLRTLSAHSHVHEVTALAMLGDGSLASGHPYGMVKIWNPKSGECLRFFVGHSTNVYSLVGLGDDSLVSGSHDSTIKIWNSKNGECLRTLSGHGRGVFALAALSDGNLASSSSDDFTIKIHQLFYRPVAADSKAPAIPARTAAPLLEHALKETQAKAEADPAGQLRPEAVRPSSPIAESKELKHSEAKIAAPLVSVSFEIPYSELVLGKKLGQGGYGAVYQATWKYDQVAVKQLTASHLSTESAEEFKAEATIMATLRSRFTIQFYGYCTKPDYCMVMEYMPKGSLFNLLHSKEPISASMSYKIVTDIACSLAFLHSSHIFHRDLKSLNVLLDEHYQAKLCDFGLSKVKSETRTSTSKGGAVGTLAWMAPELLEPDAHFTASADIYSLAITFWEIATRKIPFANAASPQLIPLWAAQGKREKIPEDCSPKLASLIIACWAPDASKRPTAAQVVDFLRSDQAIFKLPEPQAPRALTSADLQANLASITTSGGVQGNFMSGPMG